MATQQFNIQYTEFDSVEELPDNWKKLLWAARAATPTAYAPYSKFQVAAAAFVAGQIVTATNQENASYPVGICAERTLLGVLATQFNTYAIDAMAISYNNTLTPLKNNMPISPCGLCRQSLLEYEQRIDRPFVIILGGMDGKVLVVEKASDLLPFYFDSSKM